MYSVDYRAPYIRHIQLHATHDAGGQVYGVTQLSDTIYFVCRESPTIFGYKHLNSKVDVKVKEMKQPRGIAACTIVKCLYVCDFHQSCVWRVIPEHGAEPLVDRFVEDIQGRAVSVSSTGQLAVAGISDKLVPGKLFRGVVVYNTDGGKLLQIDTTLNNMKNPIAAVQTSAGSWLVSNGLDNDASNLIYELGKDGKIIDSYGNPRRKNIGDNELSSIVLGKTENEFLVLEPMNHRIFLFQRRPMKLKHVLLDTPDNNELSSPLYLNRETGVLIVGMIDKVLLYKLYAIGK